MNPDVRILSELYDMAHRDVGWAGIGLDKAAAIHIAIMSEPFLSYVFSGQKTIESRFSLNCITPYQEAQIGDIVFMKAGYIVGCFKVGWVNVTVRCFV